MSKYNIVLGVVSFSIIYLFVGGGVSKKHIFTHFQCFNLYFGYGEGDNNNILGMRRGE